MSAKWVRVSVQVAVFLVLPTWLEMWILPKWIFKGLHFSGYWNVVAYRLIDSLIWIGVIAIVKPRALARFKVRREPKRLLIALGVGFAYVGGNVIFAPYKGNSALMIAQALLFTLMIGVNEESFSRGLIFGCFEQYGVWVAAIVSSVHFGLLHFANYFWGGYSLRYNISQIIGAAAFGFMSCGLMVYSRTIWLPMLIHGLTDFPMQLVGVSAFVKATTGRADWWGTVVEVFTCVLIGWALMARHDQREMRRMRELGVRFGLVEV